MLALLSTHRSSAVADLCSSHPGRLSPVIRYFARVRDPIYKWVAERVGQCVSEVFDSYDTNPNGWCSDLRFGRLPKSFRRLVV